MKKSLIALAVAGAMTAPLVAQADATLYGKVEALYQSVDNESTTDTKGIKMDDVIFGIKGSNATDIDGVSAVYKMEFEFNESSTTSDSAVSSTAVRYAYAGLTGDFGTVLAGRQSNPTESVEGLIDVTNKGGNELKSEDRVGAALAYASPDMGGVTAAAAIVMDDQTAADSDVDGYSLNVMYSAGGLTAGLGYSAFGDTYTGSADSETLLVLGVGYSMDALTFGLGYESADDGDGGEDNLWAANVGYSAGKADLYLSYINYDADTTTNSDSDETTVGVSYSLGGKASLGAEYIVYNSDAAGDDYDEFNVSYTVKF